MFSFNPNMPTPLATSLKSIFYGYDHAMTSLNANIFLSIFSSNFGLKYSAKIFEIS